ncbi:MAG: AAA family ATPase, partial [Acidobacteriota bacterium]
TLFDLAPFDLDALLVCLAPELDLRFETLYAYLHDDVTRKRPSAGLVLELACREPTARIDARIRLGAGAPLLRHRLLVRESAPQEPPFLARALRVDERVVVHLLELDRPEQGPDQVPDEVLAPLVRRVEPRARLEELAVPAAFRDGLRHLLRRQTPVRLVLHGPSGVGKAAAVEALCAELGLPLLAAPAPRLLAAARDEGGARALADRLLREARLTGAAVCLSEAEHLQADDHRNAPGDPHEGGEREPGPPRGSGRFGGQEVLEAVAGSPAPVFLLAETPWPPEVPGDGGAFCRVRVPRPDHRTRCGLWREQLAAHGLHTAPGADLDAIAERFAFGAGRIRRAVVEARHRAWLSGDGDAPLSTSDLLRACRAQGDGRLARLARKITPLYTWDDIVLAPDRMLQLREICAHVRHHRTVFERWGFDRTIARGKGVAVLFVGPSGGGKTMAAEILAGELGLDLYTIDLSSVVSKYIGETEKNLAHVFREAEESPVVLFFDEADALFGRRSQVKDAHDRYANIEINYLLQRMEEHEGVVILASNFRQNLDEAFTRRLRFVVELPMPAEDERMRLWERMLPEALPRAADVDLDFLARKFKLTGGQIKNIALAAAFMAAEDGAIDEGAAGEGRPTAAGRCQPVCMTHLVRATQRELQKTGRLCVKGDFEHYFDLVRAGDGVVT